MKHITLDAESTLFSPFTTGDKRECLKTAEILLQMQETAQREGMLALEEKYKDTNIFLLKKGISLICDGWDPEIVKNILETYVSSSVYKGAELLKRVLIVEGLLSIQAGENFALMFERLLALLGEDFYDEAFAHLSSSKKVIYDEVVASFFADMDTETFPEGTNLLEAALLNESDDTIQDVLRGIEIKEFSDAFGGSSKKMQKKFLNNVSSGLAVQIINACFNNPPPTKNAIVKAQHVMLGVYYKLVAQKDEI